MKDYFLLSEEQRAKLEKNFLNDPDSFYKKAEEDHLKENLNKSFKERFLTMTRLMKMGIMLSKAKISSANSSQSK
jgi:hypothetical protein